MITAVLRQKSPTVDRILAQLLVKSGEPSEVVEPELLWILTRFETSSTRPPRAIFFVAANHSEGRRAAVSV